MPSLLNVMTIHTLVYGDLPRQQPFETTFEVYWPCADGRSAVNAIDMQLRDPINSGLTRWCMALKKCMDAAAEIGKTRKYSTRFSLSMEMRWLTQDGTPEHVPRDQILRRERKQGNIHFPCSAEHEEDWQPYPG